MNERLPFIGGPDAAAAPRSERTVCRLRTFFHVQSDAGRAARWNVDVSCSAGHFYLKSCRAISLIEICGLNRVKR